MPSDLASGDGSWRRTICVDAAEGDWNNPALFEMRELRMFAVATRLQVRSWACAGLILGLTLCSMLRAQTPVNPLRNASRLLSVPASAMDAEQADVWAEPTPAIRQVVAAEGQPPEPPSIVPPQFGEPETLPPPRMQYDLPPEAAPFDAHTGGWGEHYVHHWFDEPWFSHSDPNDPFRHIGLGHPLMGTSWRNRPWFAGTFMGGVLFADVVQDRLDLNDTGIWGARLGNDFDHYWGAEFKFAFAQPQLRMIDGTPLNSTVQNYFGDVSLVCYPWGDSRWRPYLSAGVGFQTLHFFDEFDRRVSETPLSIPLGGGLKVFCSPWFTVRFDISDNVLVGNDQVSFSNNFSLLVGCEYRFGGRRTSYYPWHNNTTYW